MVFLKYKELVKRYPQRSCALMGRWVQLFRIICQILGGMKRVSISPKKEIFCSILFTFLPKPQFLLFFYDATNRLTDIPSAHLSAVCKTTRAWFAEIPNNKFQIVCFCAFCWWTCCGWSTEDACTNDSRCKHGIADFNSNFNSGWTTPLKNLAWPELSRGLPTF